MNRKCLSTLVVAAVVLPAMVFVAAFGYAALGGLPAVRFTGDQIDALAWLPVLTVYAVAAIVIAAFFNNVFTWEPSHSAEAQWVERALSGDVNARWVLVRNDVRWCVLLVLSGAFLWVAR